jgi:6-hydroxytryprostatin B O-methyltransferase
VGSIEYQKLAELVDTPIAQLKAIVRMAMTNRVLCEPEPNQVAHTTISASFVRNPMLRDWAVYMADKSAACALKMTDAAVKWPGSTSKSQTGFNIAFDTDLPYFDFIQTRPDHMKDFVKYMRMVTNTDGLALRHLVNGFRWGQLGTATVVDVSIRLDHRCQKKLS